MQSKYRNKQIGEGDAKSKTPKVEGNDYIFPNTGIKINASSAEEADRKHRDLLKRRKGNK